MKFKKSYIPIISTVGLLGVLFINNTVVSMAKPNEDTPDLKIEVNEVGQTYGSNTILDDPKMDDNGNPIELDLILVEATNGKVGYALKEDFYDIANQPKNPEEAVAYMERIKKQGDRIIPVYEKDGTSIIGTFKITSN